MTGVVCTVQGMFQAHRFIGELIPCQPRKRFGDMNDDQYFFCVVFVASSICQRDSCFEAFSSQSEDICWYYLMFAGRSSRNATGRMSKRHDASWFSTQRGKMTIARNTHLSFYPTITIFLPRHQVIVPVSPVYRIEALRMKLQMHELFQLQQ